MRCVHVQGDKTEYYSCDECKGKTAATINMRIHRFPRILMLHIKRFTYTGDHLHSLLQLAAPRRGHAWLVLHSGLQNPSTSSHIGVRAAM